MKIMDASKWNWAVNFIASSSFFMRVGCFSFRLINLLLLGISICLLLSGGVAFLFSLVGIIFFPDVFSGIQTHNGFTLFLKQQR
jgi:hypothetical protein